MAEILAIIPARSGSKGVVDKNIKLLAGRPMLAYTIAAALLTPSIARVIVSTDSQRYADIAMGYGAEVPFLRPAELSQDLSTDYDVMKHLLDWLQENEDRYPEFLVHLRPTTPLRDPTHIANAIRAFIQADSATALRSVHKMSESAYKTFEIDHDYLKCVGSGSFALDAANRPRQSFSDTFHGNGYVDILRVSHILRERKIHGDRVMAYVTPPAFEVDSIEDFEYLEYTIAKHPEILNTLFGTGSVQ